MPDELLQVFWASFLNWAVHEHQFRAAFEQQSVPLDSYSPEYMVAFVEWLTREHYGLEHAPKAYREYVEGKK